MVGKGVNDDVTSGRPCPDSFVSTEMTENSTVHSKAQLYIRKLKILQLMAIFLTVVIEVIFH